MNPGKLPHPHEWNFDNVPRDELVACCVWEYARESETLGTYLACLELWWQSQPFRPSAQDDDFVENPPEAQERAKALLKQVKDKCDFDPQVFKDSFWKNNLATIFGGYSRVPHYVYLFLHSIGKPPVPWQKLGVDGKRLTETYSKPFWFASASDLRELLRARKKLDDPVVSAPALDEKQMVLQVYRDSEALQPVSLGGGHSLVALRIPWKWYTDAEIKKAICDWVDNNRPEDVEAPRSRGHDLEKEARADLTRLAAMRLLARFTPVEIIGNTRRQALPECRAINNSKQFASDKWCDATKWRDARRDAGKRFHELLPFLPTSEKPLSWVRQTQPTESPPPAG
jgi:hypothetical protein